MFKKESILKDVEQLMKMYKNGELGGEVMPEDANPHFEKSSNVFYFANGIKLSEKFLYIMGECK